VSGIDFRHATELIRRAHVSSSASLDSGAARLPRPERILALHTHPLDAGDSSMPA
jgi:hypothetical protein